MNREELLDRVRKRATPWDLLIIGGGATGVGAALDAATRGYEVLLLEQSDFGKGTSSRSTKLVHGGVRYLQQGNIGLVREALRERGILLRAAPHLVWKRSLIVPAYQWWERAYYGLGLKTYDRLAGKHGLGRSTLLSAKETRQRLPTLISAGLRGGVAFWDGQFDDARLLIQLALAALARGAALINYLGVVELIQDAAGRVTGAVARDQETSEVFPIAARMVINAAGPFCDAIRQMADARISPLVAASQGAHVVLDRSFLPSDAGLMVPRTSDGRVMFAIPWHGMTLLGTTDTPVPVAELEPRPLASEVDFILSTAAQYLRAAPTRGDVRSAFAGIRPLVRPHSRGAAVENTAVLSRDHTIQLECPGLLTITGGKWTTYRNMAEDCINQAAAHGGLPQRQSGTRHLDLRGAPDGQAAHGTLAMYGADAAKVQSLADSGGLLAQLHPDLPYLESEVVWAVRHEGARTVEDVLARRTRALFLDARAAMAMAPRVAELMSAELRQSQDWQAEQVARFHQIAAGYLVET